MRTKEEQAILDFLYLIQRIFWEIVGYSMYLHMPYPHCLLVLRDEIKGKSGPGPNGSLIAGSVKEVS